MRLFVAVELCEEARRAAEQTAEQLRVRLGRTVAARWTEPEKLHITARFIGHVPDDRAAPLIEAIIEPLETDAFDVRLGGCGLFPASGQPRVIWIGLAEGLAPLSSIYETLNHRLSPLGYEPERRPFSAHVTLARIKEVKRGANMSVRKTVTEFPSPDVACRVMHATLFRSRLSPAGSKYEALAQLPLRAPRDI